MACVIDFFSGSSSESLANAFSNSSSTNMTFSGFIV